MVEGGSVDQVGNPTQAEALGMTDLNGGALFNAEFGIKRRGSTVPKSQVLHSDFAAASLIVIFLPNIHRVKPPE
jgi:hypothetical protein